MTYNPHLDQPVDHLGVPLPQARAAVIALHGRGGDPGSILDVGRRIGFGDLAWLAPAAQENSWYPDAFTAPLENNEPALTWTLERIATLLDEAAGHGLGAERIVLLGFSQGACAAAEYAVRNARRYGGLVLFSGGLMGPPGTRWDLSGGFDGMPALVGSAREDPQVPVQRLLETRDVLRAMDAVVTEHFYDGPGHLVSDGEIDAARAIMERL
ncbi:MAG: phospholipase [Gammaproteobacteria bacterium]|jgi:phospholipase/carboxylesterase